MAFFAVAYRDAGESSSQHHIHYEIPTDECSSIVEYASRDQAQQAITTLSNQNLMGRLVYVREVRAMDQRQMGQY